MSAGKPTSIYLEEDVRRILDARTAPGSSRSSTLGIIVRRFDELFRLQPHDVPADRRDRRRAAEELARRHGGVDAGDVEHVLSNLLLTPRERLKRRIGRGKGIRPSPKR